MRKLSLVIAGILGAGTPLISQAATLGEARVQSNLTEPLEVEVPLARSSNEPLDEIKVQLAPPAFYEQAGVPLSSVPANLIFNIESRAGRDYVVIRTRRAVRDPILSILLEVRSTEGRMIREYNLLLDPPGVDAGPADSDTGATAGTQPAPSRTSRSTWEPVEPATGVAMEDTYRVERGDTLSEIAARYVTPGEDIRPLMQAIIDANPQAFVNGNGNALMAEAELKVPSSSAPSTDSAESVESQTTSGPALELLEPGATETGTEAEPAEPRTHADIVGLSREAPLRAIDTSVAPEEEKAEPASALDLEELESVKAENEALTDQLGSLSDQIDEITVSIEERDARIANLQNQIEQARAENAELQELQGNFWIQWGKYLVGGLGAVVLALLLALGLRRGRKEPEPAPEPVTPPSFDTRSASSTAGTTATGAAVGGATMATATSDESAPEQPAPSVEDTSNEQDPLDPRTALDEARMLESFNLTQQAIDLLEDSLAEHPDHEGLEEALTRLRGGGTFEAESEADAETDLPEMEEPREPAETSVTETSAEPSPSESLEMPEAEVDEPLSVPEEEAPTAAEESVEPAESDESQSTAGTIAWDEDLDNVLATPETEGEAEPRDARSDLMDFEDSYALETPAEDRERETESSEEIDFSLPELEETGDSDAASEEPAPTWSEKEEGEARPEGGDLGDLDLNEFSPEEVAEPEAGEESQEAAASEPSEGSEQAEDTRVSLAEAFLDVGDQESFDMIESELKEEGATDALQRLEELKKRYE